MKTLNIDSILSIASKTPSGDNVQQWIFSPKESENQLDIYHDHIIAKHAFNPENIASCLSFGMMMFLIEDEALRQGYLTKFNVFEEGLTNSDKIFIQCKFEVNESDKKPYYSVDTVLARSIGRGYFKKKEKITEDLKDLFNELSTDSDLIKFSVAEKVSNETLKAMKKIEYAFWNKKNYLKDIFKWVHFTNSYYQKTRRGFHWKELGLNPQELGFVYLIKKFTSFAIGLFNAGAYLMIYNKLAGSLNNAGLLLISLKRKPTTQEWLEIGKKVMRVWLKLTELGMVVQPLSIQSFFVSFHKWGININDWSVETIANLEKNLQEDFKTTEAYTPFWMQRFGVPAQKTTYRSLRVPVRELIKAK